VPGCEPTSAMTSPSLSYILSEYGCCEALIDVNLALDAIPGSYIKLGANYNRGNTRQKWFVLPKVGTDCPCEKYDDYYQILKSLCQDNEITDSTKDYCDVNDMGYCPSPDFNDIVKPETSPYKDEGTFPQEAGVLPPVPPWGLSGT